MDMGHMREWNAKLRAVAVGGVSRAHGLRLPLPSAQASGRQFPQGQTGPSGRALLAPRMLRAAQPQ